MSPCNQAFVEYGLAEAQARAKYVNFWASLFEKYGFVVNNKGNVGFLVEWNGNRIEGYCDPRYFQGAKITWKRYPDFVRKKIRSEAGLEKFLRVNQLGKPS